MGTKTKQPPVVINLVYQQKLADLFERCCVQNINKQYQMAYMSSWKIYFFIITK